MATHDHLTAEEEFRLTGTLSAKKIEVLLDFEAMAQALAGVENRLLDAKAQFPSEDFLSGALLRLQALAKRVRGSNRTELLEIIESLVQIQSQQFQSSEHGISELDEAIGEIIGVEPPAKHVNKPKGTGQ